MAYLCDDCSYRGMTSGEQGECPACGSYNLHRKLLSPREESKPARWRLVTVVVLWATLVILITWKLGN